MRVHLEFGEIDPILLGPLAHDAVVVRRVGGLEEDLRCLLAVVHPVQSALVVLWRQLFGPERLAAAGGYEQEGVQRHRSEFLGEGHRSSRYSTFSRVIVELICTWTPASIAVLTPRTAPSNAPGTPRNLSCSSAVGKSMLMEMRGTPALHLPSSLWCDQGAVRRHHGAEARADRVLHHVPVSSRMSGSPPVRMSTGLLNDTMSSMRTLHCSSESSPG